MYADKKYKRDNPIKLRFSDTELAEINKIVARTGMQPAAVMRELLMAQVSLELEKMEGAEESLQ